MQSLAQEDITLVGTLNQMAVGTELYDTVAGILRTIRAALQPAPDHPRGDGGTKGIRPRED